MDLFSRRHKLERPSVGLVHENIPQGVRRALWNLLYGSIPTLEYEPWMLIQGAMFRAPQVRRDFQFERSQPLSRIQGVIETCEWYTFLDTCELLAALFDSGDWTPYRQQFLTQQTFQKMVNEIFADNSIGYELLSDGRIQKLGAPSVDKVVAEVRQVLQNPEYGGPNEQFEKAIGFLNQRPDPDTPNCVKDAVGAVEGLARILAGDDKPTLSEILDREPFRSNIHGALREMIKKLYGYRGDAEGAAHGKTSIETIPVEEAELALGTSASCMIYLAKKFGKEP